MKTITIRLSDDMSNRLNKVIFDSGSTQSEIIREALEKHLSIQTFKDLRRKILPFAEAQGYLIDEDIFKEIS